MNSRLFIYLLTEAYPHALQVFACILPLLVIERTVIRLPWSPFVPEGVSPRLRARIYPFIIIFIIYFIIMLRLATLNVAFRCIECIVLTH